MRSASHAAGPDGPHPARPASPPAVPNVAWAVALASVATVALALVIEQSFVLDDVFLWRVLLLLLIGGSALVVLAAKHGHAKSFGAANAVTLARGALTTVLFALLGAGTHAAVAWLIVSIAVVALILDGVDGRLARRRGEVSDFGARFDMETDALLILVMTGLAWQFGKAGPWIVLAGALRYAFIAAGLGFAWLRRALPSSRRRQTICVIQIVSLVACLLPPVAPPFSSWIALVGLLLLLSSFAIDAAWLARRTAAARISE